MRKVQIFSAIAVGLLCLAVAGSATGGLTILTRSEKVPVADWLASLKQSLLAGKSTVIMHTTADGTLLIAELIVDAEAISIITTRKEASGWAKALAKAGDARIITFEEIAAELE